MKKTRFFAGISGILLILALVFTGCLNDVTGDDEAANAQTPVITAHPQSAGYDESTPNNSVTALSVTASVSDGGNLSYQWYSNASPQNTGGNAINPNGTARTCKPPATTGIMYYYVVVTNTNENATGNKTASATSNYAFIAVGPLPRINPATPYDRELFTNEDASLSVTVENSGDMTALSYEWYKAERANDFATTGKTPVGTGEAYAPDTAANGTFYYFCVVTNTKNSTPYPAPSRIARVTVANNTFDTFTVNVTLTVDNATKYQFVRGYGGMSNVEFRLGNGSPSPDMTSEDIHKLFNPAPIVWNPDDGHVSGGLGLNFLRVCMYDDMEGIVDNGTVRGPGPSGSQPAQPTGWNRDNTDYYEHIKIVNDYGGYVLASPWTFPVGANGFKTPTSATGIGGSGDINPARFDDLAQYFKTYLDKVKDNTDGQGIFALIIQNEPDQAVAYEGCRWGTGNNERDFIRILGPVLQDYSGYGGGKATPKVWIAPGENAGAPGGAQSAVVSDTGADGASQYVEFVARHYYGGMQTSYAAVYNGVEKWQTEHTDTTGANRDSSYPVMASWNWVWHVANELYCSTGLNNESAYIWWYAKRFYGFIGDAGNNSGTTWSALLPRGYVMSHFSKYAAGATRINVSAGGSFVENLGTNAASGEGNLTGTTLPVVSGTNLNPSSFAAGNNDTGGQNQPTTKVLAFEGDDGNSIIVIAYTPTRNSGAGGQNAGNVQINLPDGFKASRAELMRSNADVRHQMESVVLNSDRNAAIIRLPRSNIVSVKFSK